MRFYSEPSSSRLYLLSAKSPLFMPGSHMSDCRCLPIKSPAKKKPCTAFRMQFASLQLVGQNRQANDKGKCLFPVAVPREDGEERAQLWMATLCRSEARWDESHQGVCFDLSCCNCFRKGNVKCCFCKCSRALISSALCFVFPQPSQHLGGKQESVWSFAFS